MARALPFLLMALLLAGALAPQAAACTSTSGPYQSVRFVATEGGTTTLDLPTSIRVGPNGLCGHTGPPALHFDGRFAAWLTPQGLHVVDVDLGTERDYLRGVLTEGHLALLPEDGLRLDVTLVDLAAGKSRVVAAPDGQSFVANVRGAVVARDAGSPSGGAEPTVSVLDPVTGAWLLHRHPVQGATGRVAAGSADWIAFGDATQASILDVESGGVTALTPNGDPYGIAGDRLYLSKAGAWTSTGSAPSVETWSVRLPAGDDRQDGGSPPEQHAVGDRAVAFVVQGTDSQSLTTGPSAVVTGTATAVAATTGATTTARASDQDGVLELAAGPWAAVAAVALALLAIRRRV